MTWTYQQSNGQLSHDGKSVAQGYSGHMDGLNNPDKEYLHNIGPIPRGKWHIAPPYNHPHLGPVTMNLTPMGGNNACGRTDFRIHGDNAAMNHTGSDGCIILARQTREQIAASGDTDLEVTR